jgi:hypothetical protein
MFSYVWPIALVVLSNVVYQICAKSVPNGLNPFAALAVTYLVGALYPEYTVSIVPDVDVADY